MASKSVAEKMHLKPGSTLAFFNTSDNRRDLLGDLPQNISIMETGDPRSPDAIIAFIEDRKMMEKHLSTLANALDEKGALWIAYYKGSASVDTDINRDIIYDYAKQLNLKGVAMVSINQDWTGFRFKKI